MALPGDAMLLGGPMVGVISRCMSGRMKGIDPAGDPAENPSGNDAFRSGPPESGGRPAGPLELRDTPGEPIKESGSDIIMGLGDPKPPMLGDDMPGILNRDPYPIAVPGAPPNRGDGDGPSAILCKGPSPYRPSASSGCMRDAICEYQGCRFSFSTSDVSKRPRTSLIERPSEYPRADDVDPRADTGGLLPRCDGAGLRSA